MDAVSHAKQRAMRKVHCRNKSPRWERGKPGRTFLKRIYGAIQAHDFARNKAIKAMRKRGYTMQMPGRKKSVCVKPRSRQMRIERDLAIRAVVEALVFYTNLDPFAPGLFEVDRPICKIAQETGLYHKYEPYYDGEEGQYRHGREAYSRALEALNDLEAAGLIIIVREYDADAAQYKASRVFLTSLFFQSIGIPLKDVSTYLKFEERRLKRNNNELRRNHQERREKQERIIAHGRIAQIGRISLKNLLNRERDKLFGERKRPAPRKIKRSSSEPRSTKEVNAVLLAKGEKPHDEVYHLENQLRDLIESGRSLLINSFAQISYIMRQKYPDLPQSSREYFQCAIAEYRNSLK